MAPKTEPALPRAERPRAPEASAAVLQARAEQTAYKSEREVIERKSVWRGLLWLAAIALLIGLVHAGVERAFFHGWWRQW